MRGPVSLEELVIYEYTHCGKCHRKCPTVAELDGVWVCAQCKWATDLAASRCIEDARKESDEGEQPSERVDYPCCQR